MRMKCPKCENESLDERRNGAAACAACGGMWMPMYEVPRLIEEAVAEAEPQPGIDGRSGMCPNGHGIMSRARIDAATPFTLERCASCFGVWFDRGEWRRVAEEHLVDELPQFWSREWQAKQRRIRSRVAHLESAKEDFGDELYEKLAQLAETLRSHSRRSEALAFLREESDAHTAR
jgi:Zn-finger nucleic acid-binding protein